MSTCYIDTDGEIERLQSINAELVAALDELLFRFRHVCKDECGDTDSSDKKRIQQSESALERAKQ